MFFSSNQLLYKVFLIINVTFFPLQVDSSAPLYLCLQSPRVSATGPIWLPSPEHTSKTESCLSSKKLWLSHNDVHNDDRTATDLFLALSEQRQLLLHLSGMTCGSCHFHPLQVLLGQELLDVLLLLLQGLLQGRGAWDLPCVPSRCLCELRDYWQVLFQIIFKEKHKM